jgi:DNA-binding MarR family transcriptional regulator
MAKRSDPIIPEDLFHAIAALVPRLIYIAEEECGVEPIELLVLSQIRHFGKPHAQGKAAILRHDLTQMLKQKFRFTDPAVSKLLEDLQENGLLFRTILTATQRQESFGDQHGNKLVVVLTEKGYEKIEEFKNHLRSKVDKWLSEQPTRTRAAVRVFRPVAVEISRWLVQRYEPQRDAPATGEIPPTMPSE